MILFVLTAILLTRFVDSSKNLTLCPTGCDCEPPKACSTCILWINCHSLTYDEGDRLSQQLDILLSADRMVESLISLDINDTPLTRVPPSVCQLVNLVSLNLDRNRIESLPDRCITNLTRLRHFRAARNAIVGLQDGLFDGLHSLLSLTLYGNRISYIGLRVFSNSSDLTSLRELNLSYNNLTSLEPWWYYRCIAGTALARIFLYGNRISEFTNRVGFQYECGMKAPAGYLDLTNNRIRHLSDIFRGWNLKPIDAFCLLNMKNRHRAMRFALGGQTYACDCEDFAVYKWVKWSPVASSLLDEVRCDSAVARAKQAITLPLDMFECPVIDGCPPNCRCVYRPANATLHVDCSAANLSSLPLRLPPLPKSYARYKLNFSNNELLRRLEPRPYFDTTAILDVGSCDIEEVDANTWRAFSKLQSPFIAPKVSLQRNSIESLPVNVTSVNSSSVTFALKDNPWKCSCENRWIVPWMKSLSHVTSQDGAILCVSPSEFEGRSILHSKEEDLCPSSFWEIVLSCSMSAVAFLAFVVALYRLRFRLYRRWKFHPFDRDECNGEDMDYDVFLCCSSEDHERHGLRILEVLELKGYRVCYHIRDFRAGVFVTDNMMQATVRSKRTVCLVTEHFLTSPMCMTEFDMAFHHNVAVKRTKRLIVLMMLESPDELRDNDAPGTATLRHHVRQYTYIDYTADDWLDKLLYTLPVRGLLQRTRDTSSSDNEHLLVNIQTTVVHDETSVVFTTNYM